MTKYTRADKTSSLNTDGRMAEWLSNMTRYWVLTLAEGGVSTCSDSRGPEANVPTKFISNIPNVTLHCYSEAVG